MRPLIKDVKKRGFFCRTKFFRRGRLYNRLWLGEKQKFAWTVGGGYMHNSGKYLVLAPTGYADTLFQAQTGPGSTFEAWDYSTSLDYMPNQNLTIKFEYVHRAVEKIGAAPGTTPLVGYFAGHGGVTSPSGFSNTAGGILTSPLPPPLPPPPTSGARHPRLFAYSSL